MNVDHILNHVFGLLSKVQEKQNPNSQNFSLWINFGGKGLALLVERDEACCTTKDGEPFRKAWVEGGRCYFLELCSNKAGRFLLCSIFSVEEKGFSLVFFEGRGFLGGWKIFSSKLRSALVFPRLVRVWRSPSQLLRVRLTHSFALRFMFCFIWEKCLKTAFSLLKH